ncbi:MAG TPA: GNAT family N-acetyltransferase [Blastocatellia bacterium]|nr:GNAT family N-acetyltransferase [Blastocatellia bacterium]
MNDPEALNTISVSTDKSRLDIEVIHRFLFGSYWAEGVPIEVVRKSVENSLRFGVYDGESQVGFARIISDFATYAYLADVFILESHRGRGLAKLLMKEIMNHPELQGLRRFALATRDAHGLYRQFGFTELRKPESQMEIARPGIYKQKT